MITCLWIPTCKFKLQMLLINSWNPHFIPQRLVALPRPKKALLVFQRATKLMNGVRLGRRPWPCRVKTTCRCSADFSRAFKASNQSTRKLRWTPMLSTMPQGISWSPLSGEPAFYMPYRNHSNNFYRPDQGDSNLFISSVILLNTKSKRIT